MRRLFRTALVVRLGRPSAAACDFEDSTRIFLVLKQDSGRQSLGYRLRATTAGPRVLQGKFLRTAS